MSQNETKTPGTLFLVATPIGNLGDMSARAIQTLKSVDIVAAEDTRRTRKLFSHFDIHTPLVSFREHNKDYQSKNILDKLSQGKNIALCSDAGMPLISDPGEELVKLCADSKIKVTVIPGPNAAISALVMSGFSAKTFLYLGFPVRKKNKRLEFLRELKSQPHTLIFYESPNRVGELLKDMRESLGNRNACVVKEITKIHEQAFRGTLSELIDIIAGKEWQGEFTIVVEGAAEPEQEEPETFNKEKAIEETRRLIEQGREKKSAFKEVADKYKISKRSIYELFMKKAPKNDMN